ncbi:MAG TPA: hypothetical protein VIH91_03905 [Terriglobales bacterium]
MVAFAFSLVLVRALNVLRGESLPQQILLREQHRRIELEVGVFLLGEAVGSSIGFDDMRRWEQTHSK